MIACDPGPPLDWHGALAADRVLLLGEMHGTAEIPRFTAQVACAALQAELPVAVLLEWPVALQPTVDAWLAGNDAARAELLASTFFLDDFQDGRRSEAMLGLADELVRWHRAGAPVALVPMDPVEGDRNAGMAQTIQTWRDGHSGGFVVALAGNLHMRTVVGWRTNPSLRPVGLNLREAGVPLYSLNVRYTVGEAWNCQSEQCGAHPLAGEDRGAAPQVRWYETPDDGGYDGWFYVGVPTASRPAVGANGSAGGTSGGAGSIADPGDRGGHEDRL